MSCSELPSATLDLDDRAVLEKPSGQGPGVLRDGVDTLSLRGWEVYGDTKLQLLSYLQASFGLERMGFSPKGDRPTSHLPRSAPCLWLPPPFGRAEFGTGQPLGAAISLAS